MGRDHYRGLTAPERAYVRNLKHRIETMEKLLPRLKFELVMLMRHEPPAGHPQSLFRRHTRT